MGTPWFLRGDYTAARSFLALRSRGTSCQVPLAENVRFLLQAAISAANALCRWAAISAAASNFRCKKMADPTVSRQHAQGIAGESQKRFGAWPRATSQARVTSSPYAMP